MGTVLRTVTGLVGIAQNQLIRIAFSLRRALPKLGFSQIRFGHETLLLFAQLEGRSVATWLVPTQLLSNRRSVEGGRGAGAPKPVGLQPLLLFAADLLPN